MLRLKGYLQYRQGEVFLKGGPTPGRGEDFPVTSVGFLTIETFTESLVGDNVGQTSPFKHLQCTVLTQLLYNKKTDPISMAVARPDQSWQIPQILTNLDKTEHDENNPPFLWCF